MEQELLELIRLTREAAHSIDAEVLLAGILPTLEQSDLTLAKRPRAPAH